MSETKKPSTQQETAPDTHTQEDPSPPAPPPYTQEDPSSSNPPRLRDRLQNWRESRKERRRSRKASRRHLFRRRPREEQPPPTNFKRELYAIPNILTYLRILIIPAVLFALDKDNRWPSFLSALLFAAACITDFFDGFLARKLNQITVLGKLLDPLADKLIVASALIIMIPMGRVPSWIVILLLAREFAITGLRGIAASEGLVIAASRIAKYKTAFQMTSILCLLIHYGYRINFGFFTAEVNFHLVGIILLFFSLFFSLVSGIAYFWKFAEAINQRT